MVFSVNPFFTGRHLTPRSTRLWRSSWTSSRTSRSTLPPKTWMTMPRSSWQWSGLPSPSQPSRPMSFSRSSALSEEPSNTCSTIANGSLASVRRSKGCSDASAYFAAKHFSHEALRDILKSIKGRFILSYDDNPDVLKLYKGYDIKHVTRTKGINRKEGKSEFNEVIIANFALVDIDLDTAKPKAITTREIRGIS